MLYIINSFFHLKVTKIYFFMGYQSVLDDILNVKDSYLDQFVQCNGKMLYILESSLSSKELTIQQEILQLKGMCTMWWWFFCWLMPDFPWNLDMQMHTLNLMHILKSTLSTYWLETSCVPWLQNIIVMSINIIWQFSDGHTLYMEISLDCFANFSFESDIFFSQHLWIHDLMALYKFNYYFC